MRNRAPLLIVLCLAMTLATAAPTPPIVWPR
jgi:hypothetical protein